MASIIPTGVRIRRWRRHRDLSQLDLARRCGMPQSKISRIEIGKIGVDSGDLETIVRRGLKLSMVEFYARAA